MATQCSLDSFDFGSVDGRRITADFGGGTITSDAGALLLARADRAIGLIGRLAACFKDGRRQDRIEHEIETLVGQLVVALALGYEDLVDHDALRHDPVLAAIFGKLEAKREDCAALAGKSTLSRLAHAPQEGPAHAPPRYHKISHDGAAIERLLVELCLEAHAAPPRLMVIDLDATDSVLHGHQEGRFFHGYYDAYCYLPLYVFAGRHLLAAKLRPANIDAAAGSVEEVARIIAQMRTRWPDTTFVIRADSGFCRDELMAWCEANGVHFVLGLARNPRLVEKIAAELGQAEAASIASSSRPARVFKDFCWSTRDSWSR